MKSHVITTMKNLNDAQVEASILLEIEQPAKIVPFARVINTS
jgi:hypothetical protein